MRFSNSQHFYVENFWQAWHTLCTLQISCRNYLQPGKTGPLKNARNDSLQDVGKPTLHSSSNRRKDSEDMHANQNFRDSSLRNNESTRYTGNVFPQDNARAAEAGSDMGRQNNIKGSAINNTQSKAFVGLMSNHIVHTKQSKESPEALADFIDDDDLLGVIMYTSAS